MNAPATPKQIDFINTLLGEKDLTDGQRGYVEGVLARDEFTRSRASDAISWLLKLPKAPALTLDVDVTPRVHVSEEGFYKNDNGFVFKVVRSQQGNLYAKQTTARGLVYVPGGMGTLFADQKMTGEEIAAHGVENHYCVNCSAELSDPTSKRIGLGTSCGPQILGKEGYKRAKASVAHFEDVIAFEAAKKAEAKERREAKKREASQLALV